MEKQARETQAAKKFDHYMGVIRRRAKTVANRRAKTVLLPCPFCGGKAEWSGGTRRYEFQLAIECTKCGINTGPIPYGRNDDKKAATIWNRRVQSRAERLWDKFGPSPTVIEPKRKRRK